MQNVFIIRETFQTRQLSHEVTKNAIKAALKRFTALQKFGNTPVKVVLDDISINPYFLVQIH